VLVEDDDAFRSSTERSLNLAGFDVASFKDATSALHRLEQVEPDVVLTDLRLGLTDGMDVLRRAQQLCPGLPVVIMTAHGDIPTAIQAIRDGAYDFLEKPFSRDRCVALLTRACAQHRLLVENRRLHLRLGAASGIDQILLGCSQTMRDLRSLVLRIAPMDADVLIIGETGTGKELVARCLHSFSKRPGHFVAVNCAAIPHDLIESELFGHEAGAFTSASKARVGKFEHANHGTLFLDEVETMPLAMQAKLLRVLQEREVERLGNNKPIPLDLRVVAATKQDLRELSAAGQFRADLLYRLDVVSMNVPPLRSRLDDLLALFTSFVAQACLRYQQPLRGLGIDDQQLLLSYAWPGNIRELKSCADRYALGLPLLLNGKSRPSSCRSLEDVVATVERTLIEEALHRHDGSVKESCEYLQLTSATMYRKLKALGLEPADFRPIAQAEKAQAAKAQAAKA
jgi:DNA-binding NtrC family response regulator